MNIKQPIKHLTLTSVMATLVFLIGCGSSGGGEKPTSSGSLPVSSSGVSSSRVSSAASSIAPTVTSSYTKVTIAAPSLTNNLINEPAQRDLSIYLPEAYFASSAALPVIYFLPGFGNDQMYQVNIPTDFDNSFKTLQPTIIVVISGINQFGGSFFVDSSVTGKWSEFVYKDVVNYVDSHYRTLPKRESRGIAGHSMGGFGALDLAMRHSDVFGSVFSMAPGLTNNTGILDTQMFDSEIHIRQFIASVAGVKDLSPTQALTALRNNRNNFEITFPIAYGMAFAPLPNPPYFDYPYSLDGDKLVRNDTLMAKWTSGFGNVHNEINDFRKELASLNGIGLDCATNDEYQWITRGCDYYDSELTAAGINHDYTTHSGGHQNQIGTRQLSFMLPFFSLRLANQ